MTRLEAHKKDGSVHALAHDERRAFRRKVGHEVGRRRRHIIAVIKAFAAWSARRMRLVELRMCDGVRGGGAAAGEGELE